MRRRIITILSIVAVISLAALPKLGILGKKETGPSVTSGPSALPVEVKVLHPSVLDDKLVITGSILANESLELKSEVSGKITSINFKEGSHVKKGDLLVQINDEEILAQLEKQRYNQKLNKDIEFRQRQLLKKEALSQEEYDNALNRLNTTISDIKLLEAQLQKSRIVAPFDGTIGLRYVSNGAYISPTTIVATLYNSSPAKIEFAVPSRYSAQISAGKKIRFNIENDNSKVFEGEVYAIEPRIDPETRTLKIRALSDNSNGLLIPGQFVRVELILGTKNDAILAPTEAIIPVQGGQVVYLAKNGIATEVKVKTGIRTDQDLEILEGISAGDTLITTGILQLRPEITISIVKVNLTK